jgi:hypothetical protein
MQNTTEDADVVATTVRFPRALRRQLEDAARSSFRPLSGEIAHRIKLSFEPEVWAASLPELRTGGREQASA